MFKRFITNPGVQNFGKQLFKDMAQSAAEDLFSETTGVKPGRTGAPSLGEALYSTGKSVYSLHTQTELQRVQRQQAEERMRQIRQEQLRQQVMALAKKK